MMYKSCIFIMVFVFLFTFSTSLTGGYSQDFSDMKGVIRSLFETKLSFQVCDNQKIPDNVKKIIKLTSRAYSKLGALQKNKMIDKKAATIIFRDLWTELRRDKGTGICCEYSDIAYRMWIYSMVEYMAEYGVYVDICSIPTSDRKECLPWVTFCQVIRIDHHNQKIWNEDFDFGVVVVKNNINIDGQVIPQATTDAMSIPAVTTSNCIIVREDALMQTIFQAQTEMESVKGMSEKVLDKLFQIGDIGSLENVIRARVCFGINPVRFYDETISHELGHLRDYRNQQTMKILDQQDDLSRNVHAEIDAFLTGFRHSPAIWHSLELIIYYLGHKDYNLPHCYALNWIFEESADIILADQERFGFVTMRDDINLRWQLMYQLPKILEDDHLRQEIFDKLYQKHQENFDFVFTHKWLDDIHAKSNPMSKLSTGNLLTQNYPVLLAGTGSLVVILYFWGSFISLKPKKKKRKPNKN